MAAGHVSIFPKTLQALADAGVVVDVIAGTGGSSDPLDRTGGARPVRAEQISGIPMSLAGALHAQGAAIVNPYPVTVSTPRQGDRRPDSRGRRGAHARHVRCVAPELLMPLLARGPLVVKPYDGTCGLGVRVVRNEAELLAEGTPVAQAATRSGTALSPAEGRDLKIYVIGERLFGVRKVFPAITEAEKYGEPFAPTAEQADIALRCGRAFGIDLYGVDLIEHEGKTYVVDMSSIPGFKGVAGRAVAFGVLLLRAAERAASGRPVFQPAVEVGP